MVAMMPTTIPTEQSETTADAVNDALRAARALLEPGLARGRYACDAQGEDRHVDEPESARFCLVGALMRVCGADTALLDACIARLCDELGWPEASGAVLVGYSDSCGHSMMVRDLIDGALQR